MTGKGVIQIPAPALFLLLCGSRLYLWSILISFHLLGLRLWTLPSIMGMTEELQSLGRILPQYLLAM